MIELKDVLRKIATGDECHLRCITADMKADTGGKILDIPRAVLSSKWVKPSPGIYTGNEILKKAPNHKRNSTINVRCLPSSEIRKVHIYLITHFNNEKVVW